MHTFGLLLLGGLIFCDFVVFIGILLAEFIREVQSNHIKAHVSGLHLVDYVCDALVGHLAAVFLAVSDHKEPLAVLAVSAEALQHVQ